ncbi:MAG TPA: alpha/beta family hydrolase [Bryobacteraceae bacterium]|nr:alpha/beta family hydrolase [Bryobacteraceae bacterium]
MPDNITRIENPLVRGFLHHPVRHAAAGLVLTHGAGANCTTSLLIAVANAFCSAGFFALRFDLPFRQRRSFGPPHPSTAADDRAGIRAAVQAVRAFTSGRIFAGGHSYGGRQATLLAAEDPGACDGLLLFSYPLHPPKKPHQARTAHFPSLRRPALFIHGTADPFGSPDEIAAAAKLIPSRTQIVFIEGAGHDLKRGKFDLDSLVLAPFTASLNL